MPDDSGASPPELPLNGIRVLELGRVLAGPFAGLLLEDLGAEVIKVENTSEGDSTRSTAPFVNGQSHYFLCVNRGKRGVSLDSRSADGAALVRGLVRQSDVVIHNFRPGVARKAGADFASLRGERTDIISCAITGFGSGSSKAEEPAYDLVLEAMTGMLDVTGVAGQPPVKAGVPVADLFTGLYTALGVVAALRRRQVTGEGAELDMSLFDVTFSLLAQLAEVSLRTGDACSASAARSFLMAPHGVYPAADGLIAIACPSDAEWQSLCTVLGHRELVSDQRFLQNPDRLAHASELDQILEQALVTLPTSEWGRRLSAAGVCWGPVLDIGQVLNSAQVRDSAVVAQVDFPDGVPVEVVTTPFAFSSGRGEVVRNRGVRAPALGEDTEAVLREVLGLTAEQVADLEARGVVRSVRDPLRRGDLR